MDPQQAQESAVVQASPYKSRISRWLKIIVGTVTVTLVVGWGIVWSRSGAYQQRTNMETVRQWIPKVEAAMGNDPRFSEVSLGVYTGMDGALDVSGEVRTAGDFAALQRLVGSFRVPVGIQWRVAILEDELSGR